MILKEIIQKTTEHFKKNGITSARLDAEVLISFVLNIRRIDLYLQFERPLTELEVSRCREVVMRRSKGEPVAYICGYKDFFNSRFLVGPGVLIPRPETELLVEESLKWVQSNGIKNVRVLDLGGGSGCISLSLAKEKNDLEVFVVEKSKSAIEYLKKNRESLGLQDRVHILEKDVLNLNLQDFFGENVDIIVSNPPYISPDDQKVQDHVKTYEPNEALFSNKEGFGCIEDWSNKAFPFLKKKGLILFEIGFDQGEKSKSHFSKLSTAFQINIIKDYSGFDRVIKAVVD